MEREPGGGKGAPAGPAAAVRPRPAITHDNQFFWDGVRRGKLLVQRCGGCGALRHPPMPVCPDCASFEWAAVPMSGRGAVYSFVLHRYPHIPPFASPHPVALVELAEGPRLVSDLVGVDPEDVHIGLTVQVEFNQVDPELVLPQFRPVSGGAKD